MSEDTMEKIVQRIKERRSELGLSFQDLSDRTGMSKSTLQRYETGYIKNIPLDKLKVLAKALEVSPEYIMGWTPWEDVIKKSAYKAYDEKIDALNEGLEPYYLDPEAAEAAKEMYERPELKVLFDASRNVTKEDILDVAKILEKFKQNERGPADEDISQDPDDWK